MKNALLLLILTGMSSLLYAQDVGAVKSNKFYGGLAFSYFANQCDLTAYSSSNTIDNENFGWRDWSADEISTFNKYVKTSQTAMAPSLLFGMNLFSAPQNRWSLSGEATLGYLVFKHDEEDKNTGSNLLEVKNDGKINVSGSLAFDLKYIFGKWYVAVNPAIAAGLTHSERIVYNYLPEGDYTTNYKLQSTIFYPKLNLMGGYSFEKLRVYAGAGCGIYLNNQNLKINKSTLFQTFGDEIKVGFKGKSNINAIAGFDLLIAEKIMWKAKTEIGIGFLGQTSIALLF